MKKFLALFLALAMVALCMAGCGQSTAQEATKTDEKATETNVTETADADSAQSISFLITYSSDKEVMYQCISDFTTETGIQVEIQYLPLAEARNQISIMTASDSLPDVMDVDNTDTANYAQMGILADLTSRVTSEIEMDQYYEGVLNNSMWDGKYYGLPFTANDLALYCNMDLLNQAGVDAIPTTWDEMLDACAKLKQIGVTGFGIAANQSTDTSFQMWPVLWSQGVDYTDLGSQNTIDALNFYKSMAENGYMTTEAIQYASGDNANQFIAGNIAMIIDGPWRLRSVESGVDFNFKVASIPAGSAGQITVLGGHNFAITEGGNVDAAWEFVKYMNSPAVMQKYYEAENYIPARKDVCEASEYFKGENLAPFVNSMASAQAMPKANYNSVSDILVEMLQSVMLGVSTPEEAAATAKTQFDALG